MFHIYLYVSLCSVRKLGELDTDLTKIRNQRDSVQNGLKSKLHNNRSEQQDLNNRLRQLEKEEQNLTASIKQNDSLQEQANEVLKAVL